MILAGWSLPRLLMRRAELKAELVIGRCEIRFTRPVEGAFRRSATGLPLTIASDSSGDWHERTRQPGQLNPEIRADGEVAATLSAKYAALGNPGKPK
jgi:hypothetical protein